MTTTGTLEEREISRVVLRINGVLTGVVFGLMAGAGLFLATIWLVIKGGPEIGAHLGLLGQFFLGYTVSWGGAFIGFVWAFAVVFVAGWLIGSIYNRLAS